MKDLMGKISNSIRGVESIKWSEIYQSEEDLVEDLKDIDIDKYKRRGYKGYEYVESYQKYLVVKGVLTKNQIRQLKRISKWIKWYHLEGKH